MGSLYIGRLSNDEKKELRRHLWEIQKGLCFICEQLIDLDLHTLEIDHEIPLSKGGKDSPENFVLTHDSCNRSKQASDLRVARILASFTRLQDDCKDQPNRPNLGDFLRFYGGAKYQVAIKQYSDKVVFSFPEIGDTTPLSAPLYTDPLSRLAYFMAELPIEYLYHDERINPRAIAATSLRKLLEEFLSGLPMLHIALAWIEIHGNEMPAKVHIFDGQHRLAAIVALGARRVPLRVFVNPDFDKLLTANTHASTTLRQVAYDKSVQRRLGSRLLEDRIEQFRRDRGLPEDYLGFSEVDLVKHFSGQQREMLRYILDDVRDRITHHPENRLKDYIDFGGRGTERPLAYTTIEKTFYSLFLYPKPLSLPFDYQIEQGENPRQLEVEQMVRLMNLIANRILIGRFDPAVGTYKLENRVQKGDPIPSDHLRAYRMLKEEVLFSWLRLLRQIIVVFFAMQGSPVDEQQLFQRRFPETLWETIDRFLVNLSNLPLWLNNSLSPTVFGAKRTHDYWKHIWETGRTPDGQPILPRPLDLQEMIK